MARCPRTGGSPGAPTPSACTRKGGKARNRKKGTKGKKGKKGKEWKRRERTWMPVSGAPGPSWAQSWCPRSVPVPVLGTQYRCPRAVLVPQGRPGASPGASPGCPRRGRGGKGRRGRKGKELGASSGAPGPSWCPLDYTIFSVTE